MWSRMDGSDLADMRLICYLYQFSAAAVKVDQIRLHTSCIAPTRLLMS